MSKDNITSIDVAKKAGVSQSAVSRYYTPGASLSKKTAQKVKLASDKLGYRPNVLARSLITGKSKIIGLVVAYLENYFYPAALEKLSNSLQLEGYHVLVFMASQTAGDIDEVLSEILDYQVDGIIVASVAMSSSLATRCQEAGVPVVLFNRDQDDDKLSSVTSDNFAGGQKVADLLLDLNHKRVSYLAGWEGASTQRDREFGFISKLKERGVNLFSRDIGNFTFEEAQKATFRMFTKKIIPDALFVANDHMAFAAMDIIRFDLKLKIPEDVSVVGYDDVPPSSWSSYDLTTVKQKADKLVGETVRILVESIEGKDTKTKKLKIESPLVIRKSTKKLRQHG
jgi:DNA-binding LacI/PurR family transcriptional regulator